MALWDLFPLLLACLEDFDNDYANLILPEHYNMLLLSCRYEP